MQPESLFPLALTAFEKVMLLLDGPDYPNQFRVEWGIQGSLQRDSLVNALARALGRHPMLTCRLDRKRGEWRWHGVAARLLERPPATALDLEREPGLRVAWSGEGLQFDFHHAVCDGGGATVFLRDFAQAYDELRGNRPAQEWSPVQPQRLPARGSFGPIPSLKGAGWRQHVHFALDFLLTRPLKPRLDGGAVEPARPPSWGMLEAAGTRAWLRQHGGTVNDLAIHCLFQTLARWQGEGGGALRLMMPTSTRRVADFRRGACNGTSFAFLTRSLASLSGPESDFYRQLCGETAFIKACRPDLLTLLAFEGLARVRLLPVLRWLPPQFSTAIFTNLGKVNPTRPHFEVVEGKVRVGDVLVERVVGTPPVQPRTGIAMGLTQLDQRFFVGVCCDPRQCSQRREQVLLENFLELWRGIVEGRRGSVYSVPASQGGPARA